MNLQDRFMEWFLLRLDRVMDALTFGKWEQVRGEVVPNIKLKAHR